MAKRKGKFVKDLKRGLEGELLLLDILTKANIDAKLNDNHKENLYDVIAGESTFEVKYDFYAAKSGNIAIEIFQPHTLKPSGLTSTLADFWVQILSSEEVLSCRVLELKKFVDEVKPDRLVESAGDGNATIILYEKSRILPVFTNLVGLTEIELRSLLCIG